MRYTLLLPVVTRLVWMLVVGPPAAQAQSVAVVPGALGSPFPSTVYVSPAPYGSISGQDPAVTAWGDAQLRRDYFRLCMSGNQILEPGQPRLTARDCTLPDMPR